MTDDGGQISEVGRGNAEEEKKKVRRSEVEKVRILEVGMRKRIKVGSWEGEKVGGGNASIADLGLANAD